MELMIQTLTGNAIGLGIWYGIKFLITKKLPKLNDVLFVIIIVLLLDVIFVFNK